MLNQRFWARVARREPDQCWNWTGATHGSGQPFVRRNGKKFSCARLIYEDANGVELQADSQIRHSCGNPACLNPSHIRCPAIEEYEDRQETQRLCRLVCEDGQGAAEAFERLRKLVGFGIRSLSNSFRIPGCSPEDLAQECLLVLRYKVIPQYRPERGRFTSWAWVVMRGRLSTLDAQSMTRHHRAMSEATSLNVPALDVDNETADLINVIPARDEEHSETLANSEEFTRVYKALWKRLSALEREVLTLYLQRMPYAEIGRELRRRGWKMRSQQGNSKTVDNALMRIKNKAAELAPYIWPEEEESDSELQ